MGGHFGPSSGGLGASFLELRHGFGISGVRRIRFDPNPFLTLNSEGGMPNEVVTL